MLGGILLDLFKSTFPSGMGKSLHQIQDDFKWIKRQYKDPYFICSDFSKFESSNEFALLDNIAENMLRQLPTRWPRLIPSIGLKSVHFKWLYKMFM